MRVAGRIREMRTAAGLTQCQLAEKLGDGCAVETVSRFERGAAEPSFKWLDRIGRALGTDVDGLLGGVLARRDDPVPTRSELRRLIALVEPLDDEEMSRARRLLTVHLEAVITKQTE